MPPAGDTCAQCQLNSKEISLNPEKTLDDPLVPPYSVPSPQRFAAFGPQL